MGQTHDYLRTLVHIQINMLVVLFAVGLANPAFASTQKPNDFEFVFRLDSETLSKIKLPKSESQFKFRTRAESYEAAYKKAAQACFSHFKAGQRLPEDVGLSIIDTCANPRGT